MNAAWRRHLAALSAFAAVAGAAAAALDVVARHDAGPGTVWVVPRDGAAGLPRVLRHGGLRLVGIWAGGHVLQLQADALRDTQAAGAAAWLVWRVPPTVFVLPGCM